MSNLSLPAGSAERAWLCPSCAAQTETVLRALTKVAKQASLSEHRLSRRPLRILVVDDEELVLRAVTRLLSGFGSVVPVKSSLKALQILSEDPEFDAVISDVMMPELTGPELYAKCYRRSPVLAEAFIFMSGTLGAARDLIALAMNEIGELRTPPLLDKPVSSDALSAALSAVATNRVGRSGVYSAVSIVEDAAREHRRERRSVH